MEQRWKVLFNLLLLQLPFPSLPLSLSLAHFFFFFSFFSLFFDTTTGPSCPLSLLFSLFLLFQQAVLRTLSNALLYLGSERDREKKKKKRKKQQSQSTSFFPSIPSFRQFVLSEVELRPKCLLEQRVPFFLLEGL